ncbi:MAG: HIT domain-containing protein [Patescibacteria group bacterium]|nr:HIT domain-containing protein [Patescibacteria group bacterium]
MDCIFCKITGKEIPADILFEDDSLMVFKDIHPSAPVHDLIVPKEHIASIASLQGNHRDLLAHMIYTAKDTAEKLGLKGYKLVFNVGREGGQVIDHLHLHMLGGWNPIKQKKEIDAMPHPRLDK